MSTSNRHAGGRGEAGQSRAGILADRKLLGPLEHWSDALTT